MHSVRLLLLPEEAVGTVVGLPGRNMNNAVSGGVFTVCLCFLASPRSDRTTGGRAHALRGKHSSMYEQVEGWRGGGVQGRRPIGPVSARDDAMVPVGASASIKFGVPSTTTLAPSTRPPPPFSPAPPSTLLLLICCFYGCCAMVGVVAPVLPQVALAISRFEPVTLAATATSWAVARDMVAAKGALATAGI